MPSACQGWAETVAADRFLNNPDLGVQEMLSGHTHPTLERIRTQEVVWLGPDTTFLNDGTTRPQAGMGPGKINTREAYLLHPTVAFTPERVNGGLGGMTVWPRPEQPVAPPRNSNPLEEQARDRWLEGYRCAGAVKQTCPATWVGPRVDREGALQAWFVDAMRREPAHRAECLMRAQCHRRLAPGGAPRD
jgi:hypothetical protein